MTCNPSVSVIIPSFNRFEFLRRAIKSVEAQTYNNYEIIVINDGSSDKKYHKKNFSKEIKLINLSKNQKQIHGFGPGSIRNFGLDNAEGDFVAFLDDDDFWFPKKLEVQIHKMLKEKTFMSNSDALIGNGPYDKTKKYPSFLYDFYYKKIKEINYGKSYKYYFKKFEYPEFWDYKFIRRSNPIITSSVVVKRDIINKIGGFRNLPLAADLDCWRGLLQFTNSAFISEPLIYYDNLHGNGRNYSK